MGRLRIPWQTIPKRCPACDETWAKTEQTPYLVTAGRVDTELCCFCRQEHPVWAKHQERSSA